MADFKIGVIVGSLRKDSLSRKMAKTLMALAPAGMAMEEVSIADLPLYNQDLDDEGRVPQSWTVFRGTITKFDALIFVTPEYNRSVPGVLKNALDVGSRPYGHSVWDGKPAAVVSVSPGALSAFGANHHLRQVFVFLNMPTMAQPEAYIGNAAALFDADGRLVNEGTTDFLRNFMNKYEGWVRKNVL